MQPNREGTPARREDHCVRRTGVPVAAFLLALPIPIGATSDPMCEPVEVTNVVVGTEGTFGALFIFARFPDGMDIGPGGTANHECGDPEGVVDGDCGPGWPSPVSDLPTYAHLLLEDPVTGPPTIPGSLSHFFHTMSGGLHELRGETLDEVVVADHGILWYLQQYGAYWAASYANRDLLTKVAALPGVDLADYDLGGPGGGPDGTVDQIFIQWQSGRTLDPTLPDSLPLAERVREIGATSVAQLWITTYGDTLALDLDGKHIGQSSGVTLWPSRVELDIPGWSYDPPVFVRHRWMVAAVAAHEYGHHLIAAAGGLPGHLTTQGCYGLMTGNMTPPVLTMSPFERFRFGWIQPQRVTLPPTFPSETSLTLSADYEDGNACVALVETARPEQYLLLEARRSGLPGHVYNAANPVDYPACCYPTRTVGDGLLISHVRDGGGSCFHPGQSPPRIHIEVATGRFDPATGQPDPVQGLSRLDYDSQLPGVWLCNVVPSTPAYPHALGPGAGRDGDLFRPRSGAAEYLANAFTPFTCPSTNLFGEGVGYSQPIYSGISIFDIEWVPGQDAMQFKVRFDDPAVPPPPGGADTLRTDMTVDGLLQLTGDLVIPAGRRLTLKEGSLVVAGAGDDRHDGGVDASRVECITRGVLDAQGTPAHPVKFLSSRAAEFTEQEYRAWAPEPDPPAAGDWYGPRFDLAGCGRPGAEDAVCEQPISSLTSVVVASAQVGVGIENLCAPRLEDVSFAQIAGDRHVYLDGSDVCLPAGYWATGDCRTPGTFAASPGTWDLQPGTNVVAKNGAPAVEKDAWVGNLGRSDLIAFARMTAEGTETDSICFRPETPDAVNGDGWGTLYLAHEAEGSSLKFVDIGYSAQPLFAYYPESLTVRRSRIHHFGDTGLFIHGTGKFGAVVDSCVIERGALLDAGLGSTGVLFSVTKDIRFQDSRVDLTGLDLGTGSSDALGVLYTKAMCQPASAPESLVVRRVEVVGPGYGSEADHRGIASYWLCGDPLRTILYEENFIHQFRKAGLEFHQCADVQVTCNTVFDNVRAVDLYRDSEPAGPGVRFARNWMEVNISETTPELIRTDDNLKTRLGPSGATLGDNALSVKREDVDWIAENDPDPADVINARQNYWYLHDGSGWELQTTVDVDGEPWASRVSPSAQSVDFGQWRTTDQGAPYCRAEGPPGGMVSRGTVRTRTGPEVPLRTVDSAGRHEGGAVPAITELRVLGTAAAPVILELRVAAAGEGRFTVEVFDVAGRRVAAPFAGVATAGTYRVSWDGRDGSGRQAGSGIYFVRMLGPGISSTSKVVLVR